MKLLLNHRRTILTMGGGHHLPRGPQGARSCSVLETRAMPQFPHSPTKLILVFSAKQGGNYLSRTKYYGDGSKPPQEICPQPNTAMPSGMPAETSLLHHSLKFIKILTGGLICCNYELKGTYHPASVSPTLAQPAVFHLNMMLPAFLGDIPAQD